MQYGAHESHMGQMLSECIAVSPSSELSGRATPAGLSAEVTSKNNLNKRETSNNTWSQKILKSPTVPTPFLDGDLQGTMLLLLA